MDSSCGADQVHQACIALLKCSDRVEIKNEWSGKENWTDGDCNRGRGERIK